MVAHFLNRCRGKNDQLVVAMTTSLYCLKIIGLGWLNRTKTRASANDIHYESRQFSSRKVGKTFLHQAHTRT